MRHQTGHIHLRGLEQPEAGTLSRRVLLELQPLLVLLTF